MNKSKNILLAISGALTLALTGGFIYGQLELDVTLLAITALNAALFSFFKKIETDELKTEMLSMEDELMVLQEENKFMHKRVAVLKDNMLNMSKELIDIKSVAEREETKLFDYKVPEFSSVTSPLKGMVVETNEVKEIKKRGANFKNNIKAIKKNEII